MCTPAAEKRVLDYKEYLLVMAAANTFHIQPEDALRLRARDPKLNSNTMETQLDF